MRKLALGVKAPSVDRSRLRIEWSRVKDRMEPGQNCAYNQTRDCFLGLQVVSGDFTVASLHQWMDTLTPNSGGGIWIVPFRGIPATEVRAPLDLLYLDQDLRVLETVEFFPTFHASPSSQPASSVLALPSHSIYSSQTQPGDRLMLCSAEQMEWLLAQPSHSGTAADSMEPAVSNAVKGPILVREEPKRTVSPFLIREHPHESPVPAAIRGIPEIPLKTASPALPEIPTLPVQQPLSQPEKADAMPAAVPSGKPIRPQRGWLERWLFPEPADPRRRSPRQPVEGLIAHFFTGGAPQAHEIRDISATGLYVVTAERWYPGTIIRMTLTKPDLGQHPTERSITVHTKSVRWGNDGVGLEFVLEAPRKHKRGERSPLDPVDTLQLDLFLKRLTNSDA